MKIIGFLKRKTKASFYTDNAEKPTLIHTGDTDRLPVKIPLKSGRIPVIELTFKIDSKFTYPRHGISLLLYDKDTRHSYMIYNDSVFNLFKAILTKDVFINKEELTARFIVSKKGSTTSLEFIDSNTDLNEIIDHTVTN